MASRDSSEYSRKKRVTVPGIAGRKRSRNASAITALTAYDYTSAVLIDQAGVDLILVGDSLGTVIQGHETTIPVTLDHMIYHSACVSRGVQEALVVGDLPFLSYQISKEQAIESAGRLIQEGGVAAVKLEGGTKVAETIRALVDVEIPVLGHIGLTPQSYHRMGGYRVQGRASSAENVFGIQSAERVVEDALAVQEAGAFAVVLEGLPGDVAGEITAQLAIPTIGIGAGVDCDGQILVLHDMLGLTVGGAPRFVKQFAGLAADVVHAVKSYCHEVKGGEFPSAEHTYAASSVEKSTMRVVKG